MKTERIIEIDLLRAIAIIGMVFFHLFFILDFFNIFHQNMDKGFWQVEGNIVRFIFLILVGISLTISRKKHSNKKEFYLIQFKRALLILLMAITVTITSYFFIHEYFVRFGILHLISVSILILMFFADRKISPLLIALLSLFIAIKLNTQITESVFLGILGVKYNMNALDHFPIFPWISLVALGISLGNILYPNLKAKISINNCYIKNSVNFLSNHSLLIYMLHIPIIVLVIYTVKFLI